MLDVFVLACSNNFKITFPELVSNSNDFKREEPEVRILIVPCLLQSIAFFPL